jgi:hypothetical protein
VSGGDVYAMTPVGAAGTSADGVQTVWIAFAAQPPADGTDPLTEIRVVRSLGGGAFSPAGVTTNVSGTPEGSYNPSIAVTADGFTPTVAWRESGGGQKDLWVAFFDGLSWSALGAGATGLGNGLTSVGVSGTDGASALPTIVLRPTATPLLTWTHAGGDNDTSILVREFR